MAAHDSGQPSVRDVNIGSRTEAALPGSTVLIISSGPDDNAARAVAEELRRRGNPVICFDPATFPIKSELTAWFDGQTWRTAITSPDIALPLEDIRSIWFRRSPRFGFHPTMSPAEGRFANREAQAALGGLLRSLECLWVNHPDKASAAGYQPLRLRLAAAAGFTVPRSLITNAPEAALNFLEQCAGEVVYKPLSGVNLPTSDSSGPLSVYTTIVKRDQLAAKDTVGAAPCLFQEFIQKKTELRLVVIGSEVFPVQIDSQHASQSVVDRRLGYEHLRYRACQLPPGMREKCLQLCQRLGLLFATLDFAITPEGDYVFLDINPSGKWLWLESATGLPMTQAMADLLSGPASR
jgi:glutathione synthase/RimK-type ligase-like ATP-grasp enzyme